MEDRDLVDRLLAQNERMLAVIERMGSPVDIIRALNPPMQQAPETADRDPWQGDTPPDHDTETPDPWSNDKLTLDQVQAAARDSVGGWIGVPGLEEAKAAEEESRAGTAPEPSA